MTSLNAAALRGKYIAKPEYICTKYHSDRYGDEEIDGWVLALRDYEDGKKYPAILDIHGGPKCAYGPVFFHEMAKTGLRRDILSCSVIPTARRQRK